MQRRFRLSRSTDFKRVRGNGKSYAHPLVVLVAIASPDLRQASSDEVFARVGVVAGRSVGGAVARNRAKRLLREATRPLLPLIAPGNDIILIARTPASSATLAQVREAVFSLFRRANLLEETHDPS